MTEDNNKIEKKTDPEISVGETEEIHQGSEEETPLGILPDDPQSEADNHEGMVQKDEEYDSSEEVLFPLEDEKNKEGKSPLARVVRRFSLIALIGIVFFIGHATQPEVFNQWVDNTKGWFDIGMEKVKPLGEEVYKRTVGMVDKIHGPKNPSGQATGSGTDTNEGKRKIKYWKAPMTPGYTSDRPGKSPMGMDLIPVYESDGEGGISVNPIMVQNIGVKTEVAKEMVLRREIRTVARLTYDERLIHHIHTKYGGWIEKLFVDYTGQEVNQGDVLMEIYSPDLLSTQAEMILALKYNEELAESPFQEIRQGALRLLDSTKKRLELFDVPQHQIEELIQTRKINKTMHIHSPMKGIVIHKNAQHGMRVEPGKPLYAIADLSNIWVLADIYEYEIPWVKLGQEAEMTLAYFPGKIYKGKVTFIDPSLDPDSRTLKVRIEFPNLNWALKPEMYANVILKEEITDEGIAIPEEAVIYSGEKTMAMIQKPSGGFESRELNLGVKTQGYVQVISGLKAGERVVTSSTFLVDSESRLKEALDKMGRTGKPSPKKPIAASPRKPKGKMKLHLDQAPMNYDGREMSK